MVAIYCVAASKVPVTDGDHIIVPLYCAFSTIKSGLPPVTGAFMPLMTALLTVFTASVSISHPANANTAAIKQKIIRIFIKVPP
jgi:hypothetical protein